MEERATAMNTLIALLRELGFRINWYKVVDPVQSITFLGVQIDTKSMTNLIGRRVLFTAGEYSSGESLTQFVH